MPTSEDITQLLEESHLGSWWIPEDPDRKIAGVLSFDPDHLAHLELMDSFETTLDQCLASDKKYPRVLGMDKSGEEYALLNCWKTSAQTNLGTGRSSSGIRCRQVLIGLPAKLASNPSFSRLELRSPSLRKWWRSGATQVSVANSKKRWAVTLKVHSAPPIHLCKWKGISLDFNSNPTFSANLERAKPFDVDEDVCLRITSPEERSLDELLLDIDTLCSFLGILLQHPIVLPTITAFLDDRELEAKTISRMRSPIVVVTPIRGCTPAQHLDDSNDCLLPVRLSLPLLRRILRRWFLRHSELEAARSVLFGSERAQHSYSGNRLTMAVAALEGLDRLSCSNETWEYRDWKKRVNDAINPQASDEIQRWARGHLTYSNEPSLRDRLRRQFAVCSTFLSTTPRQHKSFLQTCITVRNDTAHARTPVSRDTESGIRIIEATDQIESILLVSLLKYLGCTDNDLEAAATKYPLAWQSIRSVFRSK